MTEIKTTYDTIAAVDENGVEYVAFPVYEDGKIYAYKLANGGAAKVAGLLTLPEGAECVGEMNISEVDEIVEACCQILDIEYL